MSFLPREFVDNKIDSAVSTATAPSYVEGQTSPLSLTLSGALRVDSSATIQHVNLSYINGATAITSAQGIQKVGISDSSGSPISLGQTTKSVSIPVTLASDQPAIGVTGSINITNTYFGITGFVNVLNTSVGVTGSVNIINTSLGVTGTVLLATGIYMQQGLTAAGTTATGFPIQIGAIYNSVAPTPASGQIEPLQLDASANLKNAEQFMPQYEDNNNSVAAIVVKPLSVSTYSPSLFTNRAANNTLNIKASSGNVFSLSCFNTTASVRYIGLYNTATVPVNTNVPIVSFLVPGNSQIIVGSDYFSLSGLNFSTGIAFAISTTMDTLTLALSTDHSSSVIYK